jgi:cobalt-zinc-cadmium efflux system outer membrane protein
VLFIRNLAGAAIVLALSFSGCASAPRPKDSLKPVAATVAERAGSAIELAWTLQTDEEKAAVDARVSALLREPLTVNSSVQIAVLNNPSLRATWTEIQLSQADVLTASRLVNPTLSASLRWPDAHPRGPDAEFSFAADLLNGLLIPMRRRYAEREVTEAQGRAADAVLRLIIEVKKTLVTLEAHQLLHARIADVLIVNQTAANLAQRQFDAGNINRLDLLNEQTAAQEAELALLSDDESIREDREALTRLLGLKDDRWRIDEVLVEPPTLTLPEDSALVAQALQNRLDLKVARETIETARSFLELKEHTRWLPASIDAGIDTEREAPGDRLTGPTLSLTLPIFNQGQDEMFRLTAQLSRAQARADALEIEIGSDVRVARARVLAAAQIAAFYQATLLPQRREIVSETLLHYNAMQKSSYEVLAAKQQELAAEREQIEALRQYWLARADLERAVGSTQLFVQLSAPRS